MSDQHGEHGTGQDFVHLHVHTEFSLLDGLSKIDKLVARTRELGMRSIAITDHGAMHGVISFYKHCKDAGIKAIIGMEGYLAHKDMRVHDQTERNPYHLLLLAKDEIGYRNLLHVASAAQLEGFYGRPRVDKQYLASHAEGLICTSGCLASEIPRMVVEGRDDEARRLIGEYQDIFGKENFFLELQHHDIEDLRRVNLWLYENREYADVPLLATNDVHYVRAQDFDAHDTLLCIQTGAKKSEEKRMRMTDPSYHLRAPAEMWELFSEVPEALENTLRVAEMCDVKLDSKGYHLPIFPVPHSYNAQTYLRKLAERGLEWRYGEHARDEAVRGRLDYELGVIHRMGFDTYFLIVWDLCQFARQADIWWNVRGSAAGSVTAYSLGITNIDPLSNNLIFERFLNPGRVSMPDIDMDFPDDRRMEMIEYAMKKYGENKVAAIITFGTLKARAAIKDVARALDFPLPEVSALTALVPNIPSKPVTLAQCLSDDPEKQVPPLKERYDNEPDIRKLLDMAMEVEGVARNAGTHAAGVIIGDKPLAEYLPLHRPIGDTRLAQVTQFTMEVCEQIGLLKVDFLGLATLTIMRKACELIEKYHGIRFTMDNIPYKPDPDDPESIPKVEKLFELIGNGETTGVFQLESGGMRRMLVEMKPKTFEHIIAAISLYRPGPMDLIPTYIKRMHGEEQVTYHHEKLEPILKETYGICVYQEQIQQIAAQLFGYSLGDADLMRRAVSKKKAKDLLEHKERFKQRGPEHGVSEEIAEKIFDEIEFFASYGFNRSHAADYAVLTCQTAYLKAHYPEEYYTALLSVQRHSITDVALFTSDCRRFGIPVLAPDINASDLDFTIEYSKDYGRRAIRYGLGAVKNAGEKAIELIINERAENGPFRSMTDFARRVNLKAVGARALDSMIKVGVFDSLGERDQLLAGLKMLVDYSGKLHEAQQIGQFSLLGADDEELRLPAAQRHSTTRERLAWEKELIGLYVSSHPLNNYINQLQYLPNFHFVNVIIHEAEDMNEKPLALAGLVVNVRTLTTKRNDQMAIITLEDLTGSIQCVLFPRTWSQFKELCRDDSLVIVRGKGDNTRGDIQIIVDHITDRFEFVIAADDAALQPETLMQSAFRQTAGMVSTPFDDEDELLNPREPDEPMPLGVTEAPRYIDDTDVGEDGLPNQLFSGGLDSTPLDSTRETVRERASMVIDLDSLSQIDQPPPRIELPPCRITITMQRAVDPEKRAEQERKVRGIRQKLNSYPGRDQYRFRFIYPHGKAVIVEYPEHTTRYLGEVEDFLAGILDPSDVQVETLPKE